MGVVKIANNFKRGIERQVFVVFMGRRLCQNSTNKERYKNDRDMYIHVGYIYHWGYNYILAWMYIYSCGDIYSSNKIYIPVVRFIVP